MELTDTRDISVTLESSCDDWDSLEIRLNPTTLINEERAGHPFARNDNINLATEPVTFEECLSELKRRDLTDQKNLVVQQQREIDEHQRLKSCWNRGCWPKLCLFCNTSLGKELAIECQTVLALAKVPFSDSDPLHVRMLTTLYRSCSLATPATVKRYGAHWEFIGFQGTDPATDLRGAGIFGLLQLVAFTSDSANQNRVKAIIDLSQDTVQNFPFAIVGINITKSILTSLRKKKLDRLCKKEGSVIQLINKLYRGGLFLFYNTWIHGAKTIKDSGFVLKKIEKTVIKRPKKLLRINMDLSKWKNNPKDQDMPFHAI